MPRSEVALMDLGMLGQPVSYQAAGVAGEIVVDEVEPPVRVRLVDVLEEAQEARSVTGRHREGTGLPITRT